MCCLHYVLSGFSFFAAPDIFFFFFVIWSNMALSTFWVADPCSKVSLPEELHADLQSSHLSHHVYCLTCLIFKVPIHLSNTCPPRVCSTPPPSLSFSPLDPSTSSFLFSSFTRPTISSPAPFYKSGSAQGFTLLKG